jgi:hypothetical protein
VLDKGPQTRAYPHQAHPEQDSDQLSTQAKGRRSDTGENCGESRAGGGAKDWGTISSSDPGQTSPSPSSCNQGKCCPLGYTGQYLEIVAVAESKCSV